MRPNVAVAVSPLPSLFALPLGLFCNFSFFLSLSCLLSLALAYEEESSMPVSVSSATDSLDVREFDSVGCGLTKGCLLKPPNCTPHRDCAYAMSYVADQQRVYFELMAQVESERNTYAALGFSVDGLMGGDTVTDCASFEGSPFSARLSYNPGKSNRKVPLDVETESHILRTHSAVFSDGVLFCRFSQLIQPPANVQSQFVRPLSVPLFVLLSSGPTRGRELTIHSLDADSPKFPFASASPVQLASFQLVPGSGWDSLAADKSGGNSSSPPVIIPAAPVDALVQQQQNGSQPAVANAKANPSEPEGSLLSSVVTKVQAEESGQPEQLGGESPAAEQDQTLSLVKAHGVLMLFAWLLLAPFAILSARFMREEPVRLFGLQLWFQIHRVANTLVFLLVLVSLLCILSAMNGTWVGPSLWWASSAPGGGSAAHQFTVRSVHALFGTAAVLLTLAQPLIALFRCAPDSSSRRIFDWIHASAGYSAWTFAVLALSIACLAFDSYFSDHFLARDVWIAALALMLVSFSVLQFISFWRARSLSLVHPHSAATGVSDTEAGVAGKEARLIQQAILGLFLAVASILSLVLVALIVAS